MIARALSRTHAELLHTTSARELVWWKALYELEGEEREAAASK